MHSGIKLTVVFLILFIFISLTSGSLLAMDLPKQVIKRKEYNPKLEGILGELVDKYWQSKALAQGFASQRGITFQDDRVTVILVPLIGEEASVIDRAKLLSYEAVIEASSQHFIRVRIPISALEKVANNVSGVSYIRLPYKPFPGDVSKETDLIFRKFNSEKTKNNSGIISEGVSVTAASEYHDSGYKGENTKIAVIDTGFINLSVAQANGELPENIVTKDFSGTGLQATRNHGTGVGEIVYDMAPQAQLYFIKVADEVDLENAKDYCIMQGIDIISHSWIWFNTNFTDGTGFVCDIANDARSYDLLWVNAAGNQARLHYQGFFQDTDGDNFHEFALSPIDETNALEIGERCWARIFLTWDDWPVTNQDYDLYLFDSNGNIIAQSENLQTGTQPPTEEIYIPWLTKTYYIAIRKVSTTYDSELKLHVFTNPSSRFQYYTLAHSVVSPADATGAIAAGAIDWKNWETGPQKDYSSQGPTNDGRVKPDVCGPVEVSNFTFGIIGGTSAATPHVAGAAALILSKYPDCTASQLQATLESWAVDMGVSGEDNIYGSGRLRLLLESPVSPVLENLRVYPNPFRFSSSCPGITFDKLTEDVRIRIFTLSGELIADSGNLKDLGTWIWDVRNTKGEKVARGIYIYLVTNNAGEKKMGKIAVIK